MITMSQLVMSWKSKPKYSKSSVPALHKCPFKKGTVRKLMMEKPKKPNSASSKVVSVELSNGRFIKCHVPGMGHKLSSFNVVLVRGGRTQDLMGVSYKAMSGKFDLKPPVGSVSSSSKFGLK